MKIKTINEENLSGGEAATKGPELLSKSASLNDPHENTAHENASKFSELPSGLFIRVTKQLVTASIIAIVSTVLIFYYKTPQCLIGFVVSGLLVYLAYSIKIDFRSGNIEELCLLCATVINMTAKGSTKIIFRTQEDIPQYFEFIVPGKKHEEFLTNHAYLVYYRPDNPKELLGYTQM